MSSADPCMSPVTSPQPAEDTPPCDPKRPLQKVISINGEELDVSSPEAMQDINIHDFASFEKEEALSRFMSSIKKKKEGLKKRPSFKNMVRDVIRAESFLKALKHYSHRSDSETEESEDNDLGQSPKVKRPSRRRRSGKGRHRSKSREGDGKLAPPSAEGTSSSGDASPEPRSTASRLEVQSQKQ